MSERSPGRHFLPVTAHKPATAERRPVVNRNLAGQEARYRIANQRPASTYRRPSRWMITSAPGVKRRSLRTTSALSIVPFLARSSNIAVFLRRVRRRRISRTRSIPAILGLSFENEFGVGFGGAAKQLSIVRKISVVDPFAKWGFFVSFLVPEGDPAPIHVRAGATTSSSRRLSFWSFSFSRPSFSPLSFWWLSS